ncbi:MAG: AAA family ATPase [Cyanobacteria bacterium]|nr:AAA family ATPase [Cyanobacteriota bacterium]
MTGGADQTNRFIDEGIWEHNFDDNSRVLAQVHSMQTGERIAIKAAYVKKHGLDFETGGNTVSVMAIKATGVIAENMGDGRRLRVHWQRVSPLREWYFYTYQPTIWKVTPGDWKTDALIDFAFQNKPQDIDRFLNDPYWRQRFGTDPKEHKRFRWARFYQAIADGLLSHAADRGRLVAFLKQLQPSVEGLGLLSGDQFADGNKGFIQDIDPFTLFGLFNRGIKDSNRQAIASALAQFLGVEEAVPESFEGIPVLNNQKSWFFPYDKNRDPAQIDALWQVFQSGLVLAEADTEQAVEVFSRDFDAAMVYYGVAWNLTFGLYWCRPWSFLSLDERSRSYISEKLRLTIGRNGPKHRCSAADYLQLIDALKQRFEEPDFSAHSFPELSLAAWTNTGSASDPFDAEPEDDESTVIDFDNIPIVEPDISLTPYGINDILADGCFLPRSELERILLRLRDKKNLILQGPPGTGKTWLAKRLGMALVGHLVQEQQLRSVQFHPNLSYEDFVRGWRPNANGGLALHEGVFMQMVKGALDNPSQIYVLVIEEINRGNPAQIFGELLTLLEAGKRTPRDAMQLCYPDPDGVHRPVHVPENLYVIGTMNIADRSLALVDMAFRRRFAFVDLEPFLGTAWREWVVGSMQLEASAADTIQQRLEQLNSTITADSRLGKAFRIGHSYVTPSQSLEDRSSRDWFAEVAATELRPLLHEYWFDAPDVADREADRLLEGW